MREILFRGKRTDNNAWVFGSFCMDAVEQKNGLCGVDGFIRLYDFAKCKMQMHEVDRETVGQYTGLTDKNGKNIFEGDIIRYRKHLFTVEYSCSIASFIAREMSKDTINWVPSLNTGTMVRCEVIGNIHDNPDGGS